MKLVLALLLVAQASVALNVMPRRLALRVSCAAVLSPAMPALAKSKATVNGNKPEGVGANARNYQLDYYKAEKEGMSGDKGSRGVASKEFEKQDTVVKNRRENGGLALDKDGKKIVQANRNRSPEELGLKQWSGN
jgi:hypothetical protein